MTMDFRTDIDIHLAKPDRSSGPRKNNQAAAVRLAREQQLANVVNAAHEVGLFVFFLELPFDKLDSRLERAFKSAIQIGCF